MLKSCVERGCLQTYYCTSRLACASRTVGGMYLWVPQALETEALIAATSCTARSDARLMPHIKRAARPFPCNRGFCSHYACEQGGQA